MYILGRFYPLFSSKLFWKAVGAREGVNKKDNHWRTTAQGAALIFIGI
jgi:hypothetical protein